MIFPCPHSAPRSMCCRAATFTPGSRRRRPGKFHLFCAQYCGTNHAGMIGTITVMEPAEYQAWLSSRAEGSLALEGRKLFLKLQCISCHSADSRRPRSGAGRSVWPASAFERRPHRDRRRGLSPRVHSEAAAPRLWPGSQPIMPTFQGQVDEEDLIKLIAFIKSLRPGQTPVRTKKQHRR